MRTITKTFANVETVATIVRIVDGKPTIEQYKIAGRKNANSALAILTKQLKTQNIMVKSVEVHDGGEPRTYSMDAENFFFASKLCEDDTVYGHDTVVVTFTVTYFDYVTMDDLENPKTSSFVGTTTENKLLRYIRELENRTDIIIMNTQKYKEKRFMTRDEFIKNGTKVQK